MNWNNKTYSSIVEQYPALESKSESVALAVWAYNQNPDMTADDFREVSKKTGVNVAGRAIGSARKVLGMPAKMSTVVRKPSGRGPGRPRKSATASTSGATSRPRAASSGLSGLDGIVQAMRDAERERQRMRSALEKMQVIVAQALES